MRTASRLLVASIASLSFTGLAVAQDAPAGDAPAAGDATTETTTPPPDGSPVPAPDQGGEDTSHDSGVWPRAIINRPLTLPKGLLQVGADVSTSTANFFDPAFLRVLVGYGITDDFEVNFGGYTFDTNNPDKGAIGVDLGYKLLRGAAGGKLELIARAEVGYNLAGGKDGDGGLSPLGLGVHVQYNVTPKIAIISGLPGQGGALAVAIPNAAGGVTTLNLGQRSPQLSIGIADPKFSFLTLPIGVGFQATPELFLEADTAIATFGLSAPEGADTSNAFIFDKVTPLALTATYNAMPALDVYAALTFGNLTPQDGEASVGDQTSVGIGVRYYIGPAVKATMAAPPAAM